MATALAKAAARRTRVPQTMPCIPEIRAADTGGLEAFQNAAKDACSLFEHRRDLFELNWF
jgi:hypothetical protein